MSIFIHRAARCAEQCISCASDVGPMDPADVITYKIAIVCAFAGAGFAAWYGSKIIDHNDFDSKIARVLARAFLVALGAGVGFLTAFLLLIAYTATVFLFS